MPAGNKPELTRYLPPDILAGARQQLEAGLAAAAKNQNLSILQLLNILVDGENQFRDKVIPIGETEVANLAELTAELRQGIDKTTQSFAALATQADDEKLLAARAEFKQQVADLQTKSAVAIAAGEKTQEVVEALRGDRKSAKVILGALTGLRKKEVDLPAIVFNAVLQSLFETQELEKPVKTATPAGDREFIAASRQAVVESRSRVAALPLPAETQTVVRIQKARRHATEQVPGVKPRLNLKDLLQEMGIDTSGLQPIDFAHAVKALPGFTIKALGVDPTPENMKQAAIMIASGEATITDLGAAESLRKLYELRPSPSIPPERLSSTPLQTSAAKKFDPSKPTAILSGVHAEPSVEKPLYIISPDDPLNQVFHFKQNRWAVQRWGDLAALLTGGQKKIDRHSSGSRKARRRDQREDVKSRLGEEIDAFVEACGLAGITTCQQVLDQEAKFRLPPKFKWVLSRLGDTPLSTFNHLTGLIDLRSSQLKPQTREELLDKLKRSFS